MLSKDVIIYIKLMEKLINDYNKYLIDTLNKEGIEGLIKTIKLDPINHIKK